MSTVAGTIELQMLANTARLVSDMQQAKSIVSGSMQSIESSVASAKAALASLGVGISLNAFNQKINTTIEAMGRLKDISEKTGDSVESLSKLQFFAGAGGSSIESVNQALGKLSTNMVSVSSEGAAATQALKFLGLSAKDQNGDLKTGGVMYGEIAKALSVYTDGAGKNAIARALMGKAGADQIPVMKKMIEIGDIEAAVTTKQAQDAEAYSLQIAKLNRNKEILWNTISSALLPTMGTMVEMLLKAATETDSLGNKVKGFAADHSIENWADSAAMSIAFVVDAMKTLLPIVDLVISGYTVVIAKADIATRINPLTAVARWAAGEKPLDDYKTALGATQLAQEEFSRKLEAFLNMDVEGTRKAMAAMIQARKANREDEARDREGSSRSAGRDGKSLNWSIGDQAADAAALKQYVSALKQLENELGGLNHQTEVQKITFQLYGETAKDAFGQPIIDAAGNIVHLTGSLEKLMLSLHGPEWAKNLLQRASMVDIRKRELDLMAVYHKALEVESAANERRNEIIAAQHLAYAQAATDSEFELNLIGKTALEVQLLNAARAVELDLRKRISELPKLEEGASQEKIDANRRAEAMLRANAEEEKSNVLERVRVRVQAERDWSTGAAAAFNEYIDHATNAAEVSKNAFTNAFKALEDTLYEFLRHGKLGIVDFVSLIKDQFARLAAQQITLQITGVVAGSLGLTSSASAAGAGGMFNLGSAANTVSGWFGGPSIGPGSLGGIFNGGGTMVGGSAGLSGVLGTGLAEEMATLGIAQVSGVGLGAGITAGLASIGPVGWAAIAAAVILGGGLFGDSGPKASEAWLAGAPGSFHVGINNAAGGDPDMGQVSAMDAMLKDPTKFDQAKLAALVGTSVGTGSPADTATLLNLLSTALKDASDSAALMAAKAALTAAALVDLQKSTSDAVDAQVDATKSAADAARQAASAYRQIATTLHDASNSLTLGSASPLMPLAQLNASRSILDSVFKSALGGDQASLSKLPTVATDFLTASRAYNASSSAYTQDFQGVLEMLRQAEAVSSTSATVQDQIQAIQTHQVEVLTQIKDQLSKSPQDPEVLAALNAQLLIGQVQADSLQTTLQVELANLAAGTEDVGGIVAVSSAAVAASVAATGVSIDTQTAIIATTLATGTNQISTLLLKMIDLQGQQTAAAEAAAAAAKAVAVSAGVSVPSTPAWTGMSFDDGSSGNTGFAVGGIARGWSMVGELGPELVNFSNPGRVYTNAQTRAALGGGGITSEAIDALRAELRAEMAMTRRTMIDVSNQSSRDIDKQTGALNEGQMDAARESALVGESRHEIPRRV